MFISFHAAGRWFSLGTPVSSTNETDRHNITEILLKVALNTITPPPPPPISFYFKSKDNACVEKEMLLQKSASDCANKHICKNDLLVINDLIYFFFNCYCKHPNLLTLYIFMDKLLQ